MLSGSPLLFHVYGKNICNFHSKSPESEILMSHPDLILNWSVVRHCTNMGLFLCNECGKNFEEEAYMNIHICTGSEYILTKRTLETNFVMISVLKI